MNAAGEFRLPNIMEKEVAMGFPLGYTETCLPKSQQEGKKYQDVRHSLIGNSWQVTVVSWLLQQLFRPLGLTEVNDLQSVVKLASPGQDPYLQGYLARVPMPRPTGPSKVVKEEVLTRKLINFVSVKGEDLLVQAPT